MFRIGSPKANGNAPLVVCPRCAGEEMVILKVAGRLYGGDHPEFVPSRAFVACGHCFTPYAVRLDGQAPAELKANRQNVGAMALMTPELDTEPAPKDDGEPTDRRPEDIPDDVGALVRRLQEEPSLRMG